ncbi:lethal (3) malignant blood neoplasm isoform 5-T5 [Cochliomyia hominivorax]
MNLLNKYLNNLFIIVVCCLLQQCCLGQSTTVRPYKFGFTIDEQQHRSEQRDERGIVMGEFGFITADGIYHVTVYATDEQGRFRILAMKNYPYESPPKTVEVMVQPKIPPKTTTTTTTRKPLPKYNFNNEACSGCFLTNGNNKPKAVNGLEEKPLKSEIRPLSKTFNNQGSSSAAIPKVPNQIPSTALKPSQGGSGPLSTPTGSQPPIMDIIMQKVLPALMGNNGKTPSSSKTTQTTTPNKTKASPGNKPSTTITGSKANNPAGGNTGLRSSINDDGDLYRFKYILDYHGHSETGKRNGNKQGTYFSVGDDDVERTIEYVANEFGYQPRIRWRKLDRNEIKSKENTLKDYEFVWFTQ